MTFFYSNRKNLTNYQKGFKIYTLTYDKKTAFWFVIDLFQIEIVFINWEFFHM